MLLAALGAGFAVTRNVTRGNDPPLGSAGTTVWLTSASWRRVRP
jgi:hypothetical protein